MYTCTKCIWCTNPSSLLVNGGDKGGGWWLGGCEVIEVMKLNFIEILTNTNVWWSPLCVIGLYDVTNPSSPTSTESYSVDPSIVTNTYK